MRLHSPYFPIAVDEFPRLFKESREAAERQKSNLLSATARNRDRFVSEFKLQPYDRTTLPAEVNRVLDGWADRPPIYAMGPALGERFSKGAGSYVIVADAIVLPDRATLLERSARFVERLGQSHLSDDHRIARTVLHEAAHATGCWNRLARATTSLILEVAHSGIFGGQDAVEQSTYYAMEESIAELAAKEMMLRCGMPDISKNYAAAYMRRVNPLLHPLLKSESILAADWIFGKHS